MSQNKEETKDNNNEQDVKRCILGECTSLVDVISHGDFTVDDVEEGIVYLLKTDNNNGDTDSKTETDKKKKRERWYCLNRGGFIHFLKDPGSTRVVWIKNPKSELTDIKELDRGKGLYS